MTIFNLRIEQTNGMELLVNGENWMESRAKPEINEAVIAKLPLDQQWALITILKQVTAKMEWQYMQKRVQEEGSPTEKERFERMMKANSGLRKRYAPGTFRG